MAEGFARHKYADVMEASSAGLFPALHCPARDDRMHAGHRVSPLTAKPPKEIDAVDWKSMDLMVNMSGGSVLERLPEFSGLNLIWNVGDPIGKSAKHYRQSRDRIEQLLDGLAETLKNQTELPAGRRR